MFASVIGDDECGTSRSVDARRSRTGSGSPDGVVECEAGRKTLERNCSCEEVHGCMHRHERTYGKTAEYAIKPGRMRTNRPPSHVLSKVASAYCCCRYLSSGATFFRARLERRAQPPHSKVLRLVKQRASRGESEADCCHHENLVQRGLIRTISEQHPKNRGQETHSSHSLNAQPQFGRLIAFLAKSTLPSYLPDLRRFQ